MPSAPIAKKGGNPSSGATRKQTDAAKRLAIAIDALRVRSGLNKKEFAKAIGCCTPYLYEVLSCSGNPTIDTLAGWAAKLDMDCFVCFVDRKPDNGSPHAEHVRVMVEASFVLAKSPTALQELEEAETE